MEQNDSLFLSCQLPDLCVWPCGCVTNQVLRQTNQQTKKQTNTHSDFLFKIQNTALSKPLTISFTHVTKAQGKLSKHRPLRLAMRQANQSLDPAFITLVRTIEVPVRRRTPEFHFHYIDFFYWCSVKPKQVYVWWNENHTHEGSVHGHNNNDKKNKNHKQTKKPTKELKRSRIFLQYN